MRSCPALLTSAPGSGHGKTTISAAIARYHASRGRKVRAFKVGPDYIDPTILARASGHPVYQLDLWMTGENDCRALLYEAAAEADLIIIEGVMGLFDGIPCTADLSRKLRIPLLMIIDARAMAQTFAAIALGLSRFREELDFLGVLANNVAGSRHEQLLISGLASDIRYLGGFPKNSEIRLPERHLGLVEAADIDELDDQLDAAAALIRSTRLVELPAEVCFKPPEPKATPRGLSGVRIGIARDAAFSFIYPANLRCLEALGASLRFFSPIRDPVLPPVDAVYLPGGYPELHADALQTNRQMMLSIRNHAKQNRPLIAECGGMLYLMENLTGLSQQSNDMCGILPGIATMQPRLVRLGMQYLESGQGQLRGHTFHHSSLQCALPAWEIASKQHSGDAGEDIYRKNRVIASYVHWYFGSCPERIVDWFGIPETQT